jgi:hypothetical protein
VINVTNLEIAGLMKLKAANILPRALAGGRNQANKGFCEFHKNQNPCCFNINLAKATRILIFFQEFGERLLACINLWVNNKSKHRPPIRAAGGRE